ncbi:MAG: hypothetical protein WC455_23915 [Dehalococcoidia bacterium]|jgi:hypothetical protein
MPEDKKPFKEVVRERMCGIVTQSDIEPATPEDIAEAAALHAQGKCPHNVVYDEAGWPYDFRICFTCGESQGTV